MNRLTRVALAAIAMALANQDVAASTICQVVGREYVCKTLPEGTPPPPLYMPAPQPPEPPRPAARAFPSPGLYSASHQARVEGGKLPAEAYVGIDAAGRLSVYTLRDVTQPLEKGGCLEPASGDAIDAALQGRTLGPSVAPNGHPDYEVTVGAVTFGILADCTPDQFAWFVHNAQHNNTVYIHGSGNVVISGTGSFSITGPPLPRAAWRRLQANICVD